MLQSLFRDTILQAGSRADTLKPSFAVYIVGHVVQVEPVISERQQCEATVIAGAYAAERYRESSSPYFELLSSEQLRFSFISRQTTVVCIITFPGSKL